MTEREKTFEQLRQNKSILLLEKKSQLKMADPMQTYFVKGIRGKRRLWLRQ